MGPVHGSTSVEEIQQPIFLKAHVNEDNELVLSIIKNLGVDLAAGQNFAMLSNNCVHLSSNLKIDDVNIVRFSEELQAEPTIDAFSAMELEIIKQKFDEEKKADKTEEQELTKELFIWGGFQDLSQIPRILLHFVKKHPDQSPHSFSVNVSSKVLKKAMVDCIKQIIANKVTEQEIKARDNEKKKEVSDIEQQVIKDDETKNEEKKEGVLNTEQKKTEENADEKTGGLTQF